MGNSGLKKNKKKKLIARVGICGHIYYMNKKRQFLNILWPFCMIKINLSLKNLVICYAMLIDLKRCKNTEPARSQKIEQTMQKKRRNSTAQAELGFLLGPITTFFFEESVVGEHPSTTNRIASRGSPHDPTMLSCPCDPTARSLHAASPPNSF